MKPCDVVYLDVSSSCQSELIGALRGGFTDCVLVSALWKELRPTKKLLELEEEQVPAGKGLRVLRYFKPILW